jgi:hypothetical protein
MGLYPKSVFELNRNKETQIKGKMLLLLTYYCSSATASLSHTDDKRDLRQELFILSMPHSSDTVRLSIKPCRTFSYIYISAALDQMIKRAGWPPSGRFFVFNDDGKIFVSPPQLNRAL